MDSQDSEILDSFIAAEAKPRRRTLLPWWIKTFCWIFMIMGGISVGGLVIGLFGVNFQIALYGLETFDPTSSAGLFLIAIFIFKGLTAYALWTEKDWAINLGQIDATLGIVICAYVMFGASMFNFRLEILLLIPYLIKLGSMRAQWNRLAPSRAAR